MPGSSSQSRFHDSGNGGVHERDARQGLCRRLCLRWGWLGPALLICALACLGDAPRAQAREPAASYGETFVRVGRSWAETYPGPVLAGALERLAAVQAAPVLEPSATETGQVEALQAEVRALETRFGPYAAGLEETLGALATLEWRLGRVGAAEDYLQRALHVTRVNGGLYSPAQRDTVAQLLAMRRLQGDFEGLDERYGYFFRVYGGGRGAGALSQEATLEYLRWQREALRRELERSDERLLSLHDLNDTLIEEALEALEMQAATAQQAPAHHEGSPGHLEQLQGLVFSQLKNLYLVQARVEPLVNDPRFGGGPGSLVLRQQTRPDALNGFDFTLERLLSLQRSAYAQGRALLEQLLAQVPEQELRRRALILRELGDWHQWHGVLRPAREAWAESIRLLRAAGDEALIEARWGEPVELPDNGVFLQPEAVLPEAGAADAGREVLAAFTVTDGGRVRDIILRSVDGEPLRDFALVRSLRATAFRPAHRAGAPVDMPVPLRRYRVLE